MITLNTISPDKMSEAERLAEIAYLLALGLTRLNTIAEHKNVQRVRERLAIGQPKSVHTDPSQRVREQIREALLQRTKGH
ncbi:MAG: hypothetical protein ACKOWD_07575 [Rhodoferax sp.]